MGGDDNLRTDTLGLDDRISVPRRQAMTYIPAFPKPSQKPAQRKPRYVDGHEAVELDADGWTAMRQTLLKRSKGLCECGCGVMFLSAGMHSHHWKGKTRGNACSCAFHLEALTPECHAEAHKHRLGAPYRSKP